MTSALALTVLGLGGGVAEAGVPQQIKTHGGHAVFDDLDELLVVKDIRADGMSVVAYLAWGKHSATVGDSGPGGRGQTKNLSIRENTPVWLVMCYRVGGTVVKCSDAQRGVA